jgi:hypothetical protein
MATESVADLVFGFKQQGTEAARSDNLFHPLTYQGGHMRRRGQYVV